MNIMQAMFGVVLLVAGESLAEEPKPLTGAAAYDEFKEPFRSALIKQWEYRTKEQERAVRTAKGTKQRKAASQVLKELKVNNPPYIKFDSMPHWDENDDRPADWKRPWKVGDFGELSGSVVVFQVIDTQTMLGSVVYRDNPWVMFKGFSTADLVDGRTADISGPLFVTGTTTYDTAAGGTKTVLVVEPLDVNSLRKENPAPGKGQPEATKSLDELRDTVISAGAAAQAMMKKEKFTAEETEYVAKYVNRGTDSVDGSMPELLEHEEIQAWIKAERDYVTKRDAAGRK